MEDIKVGEYVRTKRDIAKILEIKTVQPKMYGKHDIAYLIDTCRMYITSNNFLKHSPNIIDLIEVGDYVNGKYVKEINQYKDGKSIIALIGIIDENNIKSIVTKEQFKNIEYEV